MSNCALCGQERRKPDTLTEHHLETSWRPDLCLGCATAVLELEKFLIRARDRTMLGPWAEGYLREILADPGRYLGGRSA